LKFIKCIREDFVGFGFMLSTLGLDLGFGVLDLGFGVLEFWS